MVEDAMVQQNLIGMALLKEGWEKNYFGNPEVYDIACVGKIEQTEKLYDGKYNIMLYGMSRIKILDFVQNEPYRIARVKYLKDLSFDHGQFDEDYEREQIIDLVRKYLIEIGIDNVDEVLKLSSQSLESIINQVASMLDFTIAEKQKMLELSDVHARFAELSKLLKERIFTIRIAQNVKFIPDDPSWN